MVGIRRVSETNEGLNSLREGKVENPNIRLLNIGKAKNHILETFEYGLSVPDVAYQNDILKRASEEWLELDKIVMKGRVK